MYIPAEQEPIESIKKTTNKKKGGDMYIAVEGIDGWMAEYENAKQAYIDNTNSGTSLLIVKIDKEDTAYYNMDQIRGFFTSKSK